jgi:signal transduction histidine kinase
MDRAGFSKRGAAGPTLFRQIATRLAAFTLLFALLGVGVEPNVLVDLADIGREIVGGMAPKAFTAQRDLRFEAIGDIRALAHAEAIYRIYRNLIDNALVHAPDGGAPFQVTFAPPEPGRSTR